MISWLQRFSTNTLNLYSLLGNVKGTLWCKGNLLWHHVTWRCHSSRQDNYSCPEDLGITSEVLQQLRAASSQQWYVHMLQWRNEIYSNLFPIFKMAQSNLRSKYHPEQVLLASYSYSYFRTGALLSLSCKWHIWHCRVMCRNRH